MEPKQKGLMLDKPKGLQGELLNRQVKLLIGLISLVTGGAALLVFWWYLKFSGDLQLARSMAFTVLGVGTLLYVFSISNLKEPIWKAGVGKNLWLCGAVMLGLGLQTAAIYTPVLQRLLRTTALGVNEWIVVLVTGGVVIGVIEGVKWRYK